MHVHICAWTVCAGTLRFSAEWFVLYNNCKSRTSYFAMFCQCQDLDCEQRVRGGWRGGWRRRMWKLKGKGRSPLLPAQEVAARWDILLLLFYLFLNKFYLDNILCFKLFQADDPIFTLLLMDSVLKKKSVYRDSWEFFAGRKGGKGGSLCTSFDFWWCCYF